MPLPSIIKAEALTPSQVASWTEEPIVAFLGSAISIWAPTNLPTGKAFSKAIFRALFHESGRVKDPLGEEQLEKLFSKIPFEIVMEQCPDPQTLTTLLTDIFRITEYNDIHRLFAESLINDRVAAVVTTNYDCCIERAIADVVGCPVGSSMGHVKRVTADRDWNSRVAERLYFKIHGSADDPSSESLVFRLRQESVLPSWKRSLLESVIKDRTLLLLGYSGLDFEICPEIPLLHPARVLWNVFCEEEITPKARAVLEKTGGTVITGDMRLLLSALFRPVNAIPGKPKHDVEDLIRSRFDKPAIHLWRAKMFDSLSYGKSALLEIEELNKQHPSFVSGPYSTQVIETQARAFHYIGAYKRAARTYESLTEQTRENNLDNDLVFDSLLAACDNWRCYGAFFRAARQLQKAEALAEKLPPDRTDLLAAAKLKRILLLRRKYQIAEKLRATRYKDRIRREAEPLFRSAAEGLVKAGRWFEVQQLRLWLDRFELPAEVAEPAGLYEPPPAREGYEHLAFPMAQMMVFRDELDTGKRILDTSAADDAVTNALLAENLGLRTEAWKLNYLLLKKFPAHRDFKTFKRFLRNFLACEYSLLMRALLLIVRP